MKKIHVVLVVLLIVIVTVVSGIIIYKNVSQNSELPWDSETSGDSGDVVIDKEITEDVSESFWASKYIQFLTPREIMLEDEMGNFNPESLVTMREFLISLCKSCGMILDYENLSDEMLISILTENKLINSNNEIDLESNVTKKQVAVFLSMADLKIRNNEQVLEQYVIEDIKGLDDVSKTLIIHSLAKKYVDRIGKNFYPNKTVTRAEMSKILYMFINN